MHDIDKWDTCCASTYARARGLTHAHAPFIQKTVGISNYTFINRGKDRQKKQRLTNNGAFLFILAALFLYEFRCSCCCVLCSFCCTSVVTVFDIPVTIVAASRLSCTPCPLHHYITRQRRIHMNWSRVNGAAENPVFLIPSTSLKTGRLLVITPYGYVGVHRHAR
jgi:hypothetical protein